MYQRYLNFRFLKYLYFLTNRNCSHLDRLLQARQISFSRYIRLPSYRLTWFVDDHFICAFYVNQAQKRSILRRFKMPRWLGGLEKYPFFSSFLFIEGPFFVQKVNKINTQSKHCIQIFLCKGIYFTGFDY